MACGRRVGPIREVFCPHHRLCQRVSMTDEVPGPRLLAERRIVNLS